MAPSGGPRDTTVCNVHREKVKVISSEPRSPSPDKVLARRGRPQLRGAASGQKRRHRTHFWCRRLVGHLGDWNPPAVLGPNAHHSTAPRGMRRATLAVLARYPDNSANRADALGARAQLGCRASTRNPRHMRQGITAKRLACFGRPRGSADLRGRRTLRIRAHIAVVRGAPSKQPAFLPAEPCAQGQVSTRPVSHVL